MNFDKLFVSSETYIKDLKNSKIKEFNFLQKRERVMDSFFAHLSLDAIHFLYIVLAKMRERSIVLNDEIYYINYDEMRDVGYPAWKIHKSHLEKVLNELTTSYFTERITKQSIRQTGYIRNNFEYFPYEKKIGVTLNKELETLYFSISKDDSFFLDRTIFKLKSKGQLKLYELSLAALGDQDEKLLFLPIEMLTKWFYLEAKKVSPSQITNRYLPSALSVIVKHSSLQYQCTSKFDNKKIIGVEMLVSRI
jgi:hypothetical protein